MIKPILSNTIYTYNIYITLISVMSVNQEYIESIGFTDMRKTDTKVMSEQYNKKIYDALNETKSVDLSNIKYVLDFKCSKECVACTDDRPLYNKNPLYDEYYSTLKIRNKCCELLAACVANNYAFSEEELNIIKIRQHDHIIKQINDSKRSCNIS
jgi:hypothetical protein